MVYAGGSGDWAVALTDQGKVFAWGDGSDFRTGLGSTSRSLFPKNMEFPSPVKRIALGWNHGVAVTQDYGVYTWCVDTTLGKFCIYIYFRRGSGKGLGAGGRTNVERSPKKMQGSETLGVCDIAAGKNFTMILTLGGEVYSWGEGSEGRLGHGDGEDKLSPTLVGGPLEDVKVVQIASGLQFSLALGENGSMLH